MATGTSLTCESISHRIEDRILIQDLSISLGNESKLGIIGENGSGKSTLLSVLSGSVVPTSGNVKFSSVPAYVPQEKDLLRDTASVADEISTCLAPLRRIVGELAQAAEDLGLERPGAPDRYSRALQTAEAQEVWSAPQRIERYLHGLGLSTIPRQRLIAELSAGQRRRLAMALTMVARPPILLLDEPSNYLDDASRLFLREEIANWDGIVVFVSHDREFLEQLPTAICDLDRTWSSKYLYGGSYRDYLDQKDQELVRWAEDYRNQQEEIRELENALSVKARQINHHRAMSDNNKKAYGARGDRVQSQISRRVRAARERLDRVNRHPIPEPPTPLTLSVVPTKAPSDKFPVVAQLRSARVTDRLESPVTLDIATDDKLLIVGPNGSGKTTILDLLAGAIVPTQGTALKSSATNVGYLGHDDTYVEDQRTARRIYQAATPESATRLTSLGLLDRVDIRACDLSVGQRKRLELAILLEKDPDLLLFDEPTNHLSLRLCEELIDLLTTWPTAVVVASHHPWVRSRVGWRTLDLSPNP